ncbi:hypothetical protein [Pseudonocardia sp.]|uniref:hypothetical protein n=1 Tax=Pseudonocardia sp. TaxID=60912 RepID=UPI002625DDF7|nr:hypothetical protein [Pseudonocardia sp.]
MRPDLDLDPERLHVHGRRLTDVLDTLVPLPVLDPDRRARLSATPAGRAILAELDRSAAAVDLAADELARLASWLDAAAATTSTADSDAAGALPAPDRPLP